MNTPRSTLHGIWLPLVTPFRDGALDEPSIRRLVRHYAAGPINGLILAATTGESPTLDEEELERLVAVAAEALDEAPRRIPLYLGLAGADTRRMIRTLDRVRSWAVDGHLISCPHYSRPPQHGLYQHFSALADQTGRPILVYNIPYRTGVNMSNETLMRLAERANIVGVKDCSGDLAQSFELLRARPAGFSVLTGEDAQFFNTLTLGGDGGILASAHIAPGTFDTIRTLTLAGRLSEALATWRALADLPRLLFAEPSPAPIKHWLWRAGLIDSPELRLPMAGVSDALASRLDRERARMAWT